MSGSQALWSQTQRHDPNQHRLVNTQPEQVSISQLTMRY